MFGLSDLEKNRKVASRWYQSMLWSHMPWNDFVRAAGGQSKSSPFFLLRIQIFEKGFSEAYEATAANLKAANEMQMRQALSLSLSKVKSFRELINAESKELKKIIKPYYTGRKGDVWSHPVKRQNEITAKVDALAEKYSGLLGNFFAMVQHGNRFGSLALPDEFKVVAENLKEYDRRPAYHLYKRLSGIANNTKKNEKVVREIARLFYN